MPNKNCKDESRIDVSIGICAYNEEQNIRELLNSILEQKTDKVNIEEIIVICDGSTDRTKELAEGISQNNRKIKLINLQRRCGKYAAINKFFESAEAPILALSSADIILEKNAIEKLCLPFLTEHGIGIVASRPLPINPADTFLGFVVNLQWHLHHKLSMLQPKFGELIAFRNIIKNLPPTLVDEEQIASIVKTSGYGLKYIPDALVFNKGPENIKDFLIQRRRIYAGHLLLKKKYDYEVVTLKGNRILRCLLTKLSPEYKKNRLWLLGAIFLEVVGRILGELDILFKKNILDYKWVIAKSTKNFNRAN